MNEKMNEWWNEWMNSIGCIITELKNEINLLINC